MSCTTYLFYSWENIQAALCVFTTNEVLGGRCSQSVLAFSVLSAPAVYCNLERLCVYLRYLLLTLEDMHVNEQLSQEHLMLLDKKKQKKTR